MSSSRTRVVNGVMLRESTKSESVAVGGKHAERRVSTAAPDRMQSAAAAAGALMQAGPTVGRQDEQDDAWLHKGAAAGQGFSQCSSSSHRMAVTRQSDTTQYGILP